MLERVRDNEKRRGAREQNLQCGEEETQRNVEGEREKKEKSGQQCNITDVVE